MTFSLDRRKNNTRLTREEAELINIQAPSHPGLLVIPLGRQVPQGLTSPRLLFSVTQRLPATTVAQPISHQTEPGGTAPNKTTAEAEFQNHDHSHWVMCRAADPVRPTTDGPGPAQKNHN